MCRDNDTLVFIEVKTRTREDFGRPLEAVDRAKQKRISRGALAWLRMLENPDILFRFDVVEVILADEAKPRVELIKNAFPLSKPYLVLYAGWLIAAECRVALDNRDADWQS